MGGHIHARKIYIMQIKTKLANVVTKFISQPIKQKLTIMMTLLLSMTLLQLRTFTTRKKKNVKLSAS